MKEYSRHRLLLSQACSILAVLDIVAGHGRLWEPPSRATMWRLGYNTPHNYDDNQLFCGGVGVQYSDEVKGKCGVCGDPWNGPRDHEVGGQFATGLITRKYDPGQEIEVKVQLTANHKGYFEFRLCAKDNPKEKATWDCFDKHVLEEVSSGKKRYQVEKQTQRKFTLKIRLPKHVRCKSCVLQWKYNAGNSWGYSEDGTGCVGCGNQEQFYGCSDIAIGHEDVQIALPGDKASATFDKNDLKDTDDWEDNKGKGGSGQSCLRIPTYLVWLLLCWGIWCIYFPNM